MECYQREVIAARNKKRIKSCTNTTTWQDIVSPRNLMYQSCSLVNSEQIHQENSLANTLSPNREKWWDSSCWTPSTLAISPLIWIVINLLDTATSTTVANILYDILLVQIAPWLFSSLMVLTLCGCIFTEKKWKRYVKEDLTAIVECAAACNRSELSSRILFLHSFNFSLDNKEKNVV